MPIRAVHRIRQPFGRHPKFSSKEAIAMAKGQKKSNKEARKPKAAKPPKPNASSPSARPAPVGLVTIKT